MNVSVIIPTWNAGKELRLLLDGLNAQTLKPIEIIVIDSSSSDASGDIARQLGCTVEVIPKEKFDHGGTRNRGAELAKGEILVFMTQDAAPCDEHFLEVLTSPLRTGLAQAAYARQIAKPDARPPEAFVREINYPPQSHTKSIDDLPILGIKTFFFSNAASAITRQAFEDTGRFPENNIVNEDMLFCARLLRGGSSVAYQADAQVFHSHNYSLVQQFKRYFDIGVFMAQAGDELSGARTSRQGRSFVARQLRFLFSSGKYGWFLWAIIDNASRFLGFGFGRRHKYLPLWFKKRLSMHSGFWRKQ
ncbi:MAG: glycosyltransferase family 2 protein [Phycisphaerales bacterium]|jgi:rhamnosyltransferase|nr:glycosyltransferase family 2 protein [Phycisphaerales bacterium]